MSITRLGTGVKNERADPRRDIGTYFTKEYSYAGANGKVINILTHW